jgi:hypothetical protein
MKAIFFRDEGGRLRCKIPELGLTKPVETADGSRRYRWAKVFGLYQSQTGWPYEVYLRLQTAEAGDTIELPPLGSEIVK